MLNKITATRYKLIKTFFWIVKESGMGEENARAVAGRMYNKTSLRDLSTDELKAVIDELAAITKVTLRKSLPKRVKPPAENMVVTKAGRIIQLPTREQLALIEDYANKIQMAQETLQHMIKKVGQGEPSLTLMSARTLIEILKAMHARGWKGNNVEEHQPSAGKDN